jgi:hypothetical protein
MNHSHHKEMDMTEVKSSLHALEENHHNSSQGGEAGIFIPATLEDVEKLIETQDRMCKKLQDQILFDAIGSQFHVSIFLHQFFAHMFLPLFFFLPNTHGQGLRLNGSSLWMNVVTPLFFYAMLISFLVLSPHDKRLVGYSVWWPLFSYVMHRLMISLKYATLSLTEYKRFNECKDEHRSESYLDQMMLFKGWLELDPEVMFFELGAASARIGERINDIHLIVRNENHSAVARSQVRFWNAFLRGHREINVCTNIAPEMRRIESGDYAISVYDIAVAVVRYCNTYQSFIPKAFLICQAIAALIIAISYIPIFTNTERFDSVGLVSLYMISSTIIIWVYARLMFLFLSFVLFDVMRLNHMVKIVHCMIRITDVMMGISVSLKGDVSEKSEMYAYQRRRAIIEINQVHSWKGSVSLKRGGKDPEVAKGASTAPAEPILHKQASVFNPRASNVIGEKAAVHGEEALIPRVAFEFPENILSWAYLRITIQAFGERFRYRTDIYVGMTLAVMLVLMIMTLSYLIMATNRQAEFGRVYVLEAIIAVSVMVVYLMLISLSGAMVNEELALHSRTLAARALRTRSRLIFREEQRCDNDNDEENTEESDEELWARQIECIEGVMGIVDVNNELRPFKVLGITAQYAVTVSIFTTVLSFFSVLFSLYYSSSSEVSSELALA